MGFPWGDIVGQCGSLRREVLEPVYGCRASSWNAASRTTCCGCCRCRNGTAERKALESSTQISNTVSPSEKMGSAPNESGAGVSYKLVSGEI